MPFSSWIGLQIPVLFVFFNSVAHASETFCIVYPSLNKKYFIIFFVEGISSTGSLDGGSGFVVVLFDALFDGCCSSFFEDSTLLEFDEVFSFFSSIGSSFFSTLTTTTYCDVLPEESETVYTIFCSPIFVVSISL